jgi:hypothetical protein
VDAYERVYVADSRADVIRVYDRHGAFIRDLGRSGQGPGEFAELTGLTWRDGSTLWAFDLGNGRFSVFDTSGAHLRELQRPPLGVQWPWPSRFQGDRLIEPLLAFTATRLVALEQLGAGHTLAVTDTFPDPLQGHPVGTRTPFFTLRSRTSVRMIAIPYAPAYHWALDGQGGVWIGDASKYLLVHRGLKGDTMLTIQNSWKPVPVTPQERDSAIAALGPPDDVARSFDLGKIPSTKPAFQLFVAGPTGTLWVLREGMMNEWYFDVFGANGRLQGVSRVPIWPDLSVLPVITEASVWLVQKDGLGVQSVVRLIHGERQSLELHP